LHQNDGTTGHRSAITCTYCCGNRFRRDDLRLRLRAAESAQNRETIVADNLVPNELGPRNNMMLMVCLIPLIATALFLYLVIET
jgi:hypothetical protein